MKLRVKGLTLTAAALAALLAPARASAAPSFAAMFDAGLRTMSNSKETEKAIFDTKKGLGFGGGVFLERGDHLRFGVEARLVSRDGERAFAADANSPAYRLGHPLTFKTTSVLASASWRFSKFVGVTPYVGVGAGIASWKESSTIAGLVESNSGSSGLFEVKLGVERAQGALRLGIEGGITWIPNAIGVGGISQVYGEKDLGGLFIVGKVGFGRDK